MIDGVTVLKQCDVSLSIESIIFLSVFIGIITFFIFILIPGPSLLYLKLLCTIIVSLVAFVFMKFDNNTPDYHYDVIINDSVSVNKLYKNYEILKVDGKIYTIALREK
jgi:hypothetical protein